VVEAKIAGREIAQPGTLEIAAGEPTSLADALRASLAAARQLPSAGENGGKGRAIETAPATEPGAPGPTESAAKSRSAKGGPAKTGAAKAGTAKSGTGKPRSGTRKAS